MTSRLYVWDKSDLQYRCAWIRVYGYIIWMEEKSFGSGSFLVQYDELTRVKVLLGVRLSWCGLVRLRLWVRPSWCGPVRLGVRPSFRTG